jgi:type VI secretion system protein ImpK
MHASDSALPGHMGQLGGIGDNGAPASGRPRPHEYVISGSNPLVAAANPLLDLIPQIRATGSHPSPAMLREHLLDEVRQFELRSQQAGIPNETILGARYCLCTALDEAAALTPWGGNGVWSAHSLLVTFHNETWGGEKFFQLLSRLSQNPGQHLDLLELLYYCLLLGFEGRYRVVDNGRSQLETLRQRLLRILRSARGEYARELSPHWRDAPAQVQLRRLPVPLWAYGALAAVFALALFLLLSWRLGGQSDAVFTAVNNLKPPTVQIAAPPTPRPAPSPRLALFLAPEIRDGLVTVRDEVDRSVVVLRGDGAFESGAAEVRGSYMTVLSRVADALRETHGIILVRGYTDNVPMRSARYPSNWHLSQARADTVKAILEQRLSQPGRVRAEGRGDADPMAPNDTPAGRALNRRVEITLMIPPVPRETTLEGAQP